MKVSILDHGYLEYVEHWGSDESIITAARMSTGKGFQGWGPVEKCRSCGDLFTAPERDCPAPSPGRPMVDCGRGGHLFEGVPGDEKLLRYLWENGHLTPFEMPGLTVEVMAPIFVFREWHRHGAPFGYDEMSAVNYIPSLERLMMGSGGKNRQAAPAAVPAILTEMNARLFQEQLRQTYREQERVYRDALAAGVPKELARVHLPVGRYSRMRATGNLRGWLAFLTLRMAPEAQFEIREYANALGGLIAQHFPRTWALFSEFRGAAR